MKKLLIIRTLIASFIVFTGWNLSAQTSIYSTKACTTKVKLNQLTIEIRNFKDVKNFAAYTCKGEVEVFHNTQSLSKAAFEKITQEGAYGLFLHHNVLPNHVIITKHGDFDDKTIIINKKGNIFTLNGSTIFIDSIQHLVFVLNFTEKGEITVFDLLSDEKIAHFENYEQMPERVFKDRGHFWVQFGSFNSSKKLYFKIDLNTKSLTKMKLKKRGLYLEIPALQNEQSPTFKCQCDCEYQPLTNP
jgi:hypothetical protein